jgi:signal transduction histidine kinase
MLHEFITENRAEIINRCRQRFATRPAPRVTDAELEYGVPLFLDQLADTLRLALNPNPAIAKSAAKHGHELLRRGFTVAQVVRDYGGICQTITELAVERAAPISTSEFQTLNLCLDDAIAGAVTEYGQVREYEGTERKGYLAHEMRNLLYSALMAFDALRSGSVGIGGSTGAVLGRNLAGLRSLIERELAEVRLGAASHQEEAIVVRQFIEEVEVAAMMDATARGLQFAVEPVEDGVAVFADRQILASVVGNLLQNAFKFTRAGGRVSLHVRASVDRVSFDIEDQCGGLPAGKAEEMFRPFEQAATDRSGLGLGLAICQRGARVMGGEIRVVNQPGSGCVFTVEIPRHSPPQR